MQVALLRQARRRAGRGRRRRRGPPAGRRPAPAGARGRRGSRWSPAIRSSAASSVEQVQPGRGPAHHGHRDGVVQRAPPGCRRSAAAARTAPRSAASRSPRRSAPRRGRRRSPPAAGTGRSRPRGSAARDQRDALGDVRRRSSGVRSCSAIGTSAPSGPVRAGRRASVSSISASSPVTSPSSGSSRWTSRASRIASADSSARCRLGPGRAGVPLVEDQVEHVQDRAEPVRALGRRRQAERHAAVLDASAWPG